MEVWGGNQQFSGGVVMAGLDVWIHSQPYGNAAGGGDIHYVSTCATGRITRLLVADVSGHGSDVAGTAAALRTLMRRYINYIDQTRFVEAMNEQFTALSAAHVFATAVVTTFFAPTGHLSISNAGHPPPLLYSAKSGEWNLLEHHRPARATGARKTSESRSMVRAELTRAGSHDPRAASSRWEEPSNGVSNIPLGIVDATNYDQLDVRLHIGDMVMCYTDSLIESLDEHGNMLGAEGLLKVANALEPSETVELIPALLDAIRVMHRGNLAKDDVTVLVFRPNGLAPRPALADRLRAPLRVARGILSALRPGGRPAPWPELSLPNLGGAIFNPLSRLWTGRRS
jgi:hypothetical protein